MIESFEMRTSLKNNHDGTVTIATYIESDGVVVTDGQAVMPEDAAEAVMGIGAMFGDQLISSPEVADAVARTVEVPSDASMIDP